MNHAITPNGSTRTGLSVAALAILALPLAGCGEKLDCSADETHKLIHQIAEGHFRKAFAVPADQPIPGLSFSLSDIITREKDKNKAMCAAKLQMTLPKEGNSDALPINLNITYKLERTDDGRLYATVYGL